MEPQKNQSVDRAEKDCGLPNVVSVYSNRVTWQCFCTSDHVTAWVFVRSAAAFLTY